jgi:hypothetical protein
LVNKKKVDVDLTLEKYSHLYESVSSEKTTPVVAPEKTRHQGRGTYEWITSDSEHAESPVRRLVSSSPQIECSNSAVYQKAKTIISGYRHQDARRPPARRRHDNRDLEDKDADAPKNHQRRHNHPMVATNNGIAADHVNKMVNLNDGSRRADTKDEDDRKRQLLFKYRNLKKLYPANDFPDFNMLSDHDKIKNAYESRVKNLAMDSAVESYKSYLVMGFVGCELTLARIGFDMEGYTQYQMSCMNKYNTLLVELGEKSYVPATVSRWPVELRLVGLVLFQTTVFVVSKVVSAKMNFDILKIINHGGSTLKNSREDVNSSGVFSGGNTPRRRTNSPLIFIPKTGSEKASARRQSSSTSESRMKGPNTAERDKNF